MGCWTGFPSGLGPVRSPWGEHPTAVLLGWELLLVPSPPVGFGAGSGDWQGCPRGWEPWNGWRWKLGLQLHPCPCPAITARIIPLGIAFLLPGRGQEFGKYFLEKAAFLPHHAFLTLLVLDIHRSNERAQGGEVGSPLSLVPGRRAGAHVSPAICKSADIIRAVVEGITGASACEKPRCPAWGDGWWCCWRGVHLVLTPALPPGMGRRLGRAVVSALQGPVLVGLLETGIFCLSLGSAFSSGLSSITQGSSSVLPPHLHARGPAPSLGPGTLPPTPETPPK